MMEKSIRRRKKTTRFLRSCTALFLACAAAFTFSGCSGSALGAGSAPAVSSAASEPSRRTAASAQAVSGPSPVSSAPASSAPASSAVSAASGKKKGGTFRSVSTPLTAEAAPRQTLQPVAAAPGAYPEVRQRGAYSSLPAGERTLYDKIGESVLSISNQKSGDGVYPAARILVSGKISEARLRVVLQAYFDDNPQVFWLTNHYSYGYGNGQTELRLFSALSPQEYAAAVRKLQEAVSAALKAVPAGLSEFDREEALFGFLTGRCAYDHAAVTDPGRWQSFTAYGALVNGLAVCEGYAKAMQLLAGYAGLNCAVVHGSADGEGHTWNAVEIGGNWYHLDVTWGDDDFPVYNYFNVTDAVIGLTHSIGKPASSLTDAQICGGNVPYNVFLPACGSADANYFRRKGIPSGSGDAAVTAALAREMKAKKTTIAFFLSGSAGFDAQLREMMDGPSYRLDRWLKAAAKQSGSTPDYGSLTYVSDPADRGVTLRVRYR